MTHLSGGKSEKLCKYLKEKQLTKLEIFVYIIKSFWHRKKLSLGPSQKKKLLAPKKKLDYEPMLFDNIVGWYNWILTE